jgi:tRNA-splicing ligase RtcB
MKTMSTNFEVMKDENGVPVKSWTKGVPFEDEAKAQLMKLSKMPFLFSHVAVMPDVHAGKGSTVGSVIATDRVIIPATVGVDLGCGMVAVKTDLKASDLPESLKDMRLAIEAAVPHGGPGEVGSWATLPELNGQFISPFSDHSFKREYDLMVGEFPEIASKYTERQFGTLGTGNHFVEVCLDELQNVWVMLHSGSRGIGNRIGSFFIEKAKEEMRRWFINLPDMDLAYLPEGSAFYKPYTEAVSWAQEYARMNRDFMLDNTLFAISKVLGREVNVFEDTAVNCHHNYIAMENHYGKNVWVTRKGAVRARKGDFGIIPGSMGARSYIVRGKGNKESFDSCSHGAGRKMSRTAAAKTFSVKDHIAATEGVECRKDKSVIDETPGAYKDIDTVMAAQSDLVEPVAVLKQILCVKG